MAATEAGDVWGIGRKTSARLAEGGIRSVLDLVTADYTYLNERLARRRDTATDHEYLWVENRRKVGRCLAQPGAECCQSC